MPFPYALDIPNLVRSGPVGPVTDGNTMPIRGSHYGEAIVQTLNGTYAELVRRGQVYAAKLAGTQAQAVPCYATLTNASVLFNRSTSGKLCIPLFLNLSVGAPWATLTSGLLFSFGLILYTAQGDSMVTAGTIGTLGTAVTPSNCLVGSSNTPTTLFYGTASYVASTTSAVTFDLGAGIFCPTATLTSSVGQWNFQYEFKGLLQMKPGTGAALVVSTLTTGGTASLTFNQTWVFAEQSLPQNLT